MVSIFVISLKIISLQIQSDHTVVVLRMMSTSSLSSGTTSSINRGMVGTTGGGVISAAFLALKRNLQKHQQSRSHHLSAKDCIPI